jgi:hypothetical protein
MIEIITFILISVLPIALCISYGIEFYKEYKWNKIYKKFKHNGK